MNVCLFTSSSDFGGTERMALEFLAGCDRVRFQPSLICLLGQGPVLEAARRAGIPCLGLDWKGAIDLRAVREFGRFLREKRVDLIHNFGLRAEFLSRLLARRHGARIIVSGVRDTDPWRRWYHVWADRLTARRVDLFIANSEVARAVTIAREKVPPEKIIAIHNGLAISDFGLGIADFKSQISDSRREEGETPNAERGTRNAEEEEYRISNIEQGMSKGARDNQSRTIHDPRSTIHDSQSTIHDPRFPVVIEVANIKIEKKGYDLLLEAASRLRKEFPNLLVLCVGKDYSGGEMARRIAAMGLGDHVRLLGYCENVFEPLSRADVAVLPSRYESFPVSILEAMAMRLPVVATRVGGIPEAIADGVNGFLVESEDIEALTARLRQLLSAPELRARMGEAARRTVEERFSLDKMIAAIQDAYEALARKPGVGD